MNTQREPQSATSSVLSVDSEMPNYSESQATPEFIAAMNERHVLREDEDELITAARTDLINMVSRGNLFGIEAVSTPYSENWLDHEKWSWMLESLTGHTVFDLGSGSGETQEAFRQLLLDKGIKEYYGVDALATYEVAKTTVAQASFGRIIPAQDGRGATIKGDMLEVVSYLPDGSASFVINGIDDMIIDSHQYTKALAAQIERCTEEGGFIVGVTAFGGVLEMLSRSDNFETQTNDPKRPFYYLCQKKTTS